MDIVKSRSFFLFALVLSCGAGQGAPKEAPQQARGRWSAPASGLSFGCAIAPDGRVCCVEPAGAEKSILDDGSLRGAPRCVEGVARAVQLLAGDFNVCALTEGGEVFSWGMGLRKDEPEDPSCAADYSCAKPTLVRGLPKVAQIVGDPSVSVCALATDATVFCWGANDHGQAGAVPSARQVPPAQIRFEDSAPLREVRQIAVGVSHACALLANGTVQCWGDNDWGQCGLGYRRSSARAGTVPGLDHVRGIALGFEHSCAVLEGGMVKCWGRNGSFGDLVGIDGEGILYRPTPRSGICGARELAAEGSRVYMLDASGRLDGWGSILTSQGWTSAPRFFLDGVASITPSAKVTCAELRDGRRRCWGHAVGTAKDLNSGDEHEPEALDQPAVQTARARSCDVRAAPLGPLPAFPGVTFAEVRAYAFNRKGPTCNGPLDSGAQDGADNKAGGRCPSLEEPGVHLTPDKVKELLAIANDRKTYEHSITRCFDPHHGFVFYDGSGKPVASLSLCFLCSQMQSDPPLPARQAEGGMGLGQGGIGKLRALCESLGLPDCGEKD
jgi:hypothetical protein